MRVIEAIQYGGPEQLTLRERPTPVPGSGEALVRVEACGVNYIDIYQRTGLYPSSEPVRLGLEGAGVVEAKASDVGPEIELGQRVAWCDAPGSYASHVCVPARRLVPVPEDVSSQLAAAVMLQGMTAHYLAHATYRLGSEDTCLVHAIAGGVGLLLCQLAKRAGARVIGTTSTPAKAALATGAGADHVILYTELDFAAEVAKLTQQRGVQVVYDSVGKDTWSKSLACLAPRGLLVLFGQSSGSVPALDPQLLARGGSLFLTRATLAHYVASQAELRERAGSVFALVASGELQVRVEHAFQLSQARDAHEALASRATAGKLLLIP